VDAVRFHIFTIDAVIADQGIGHGDHLTLIGGIRKDFLISRHARIEDNFTQNLALSGKGVASIDAPIF